MEIKDIDDLIALQISRRDSQYEWMGKTQRARDQIYAVYQSKINVLEELKREWK